MRNLLTVILSILLVSFAVAGTITGKVTNKATGEALAGANVYMQGMPVGAATDEGGVFSFDVRDGNYVLVCDYVGFAQQTFSVKISGTATQDFEMVEYLFAKTISVVADRARDRETPVAYSDVSKERMKHTLASQDIPMVLNTTPSVYATMTGGGAGDARINVRGFDQRNVAVMINGMPVNDMENGWVYWSNWDGVGDATSSIQVQRGLSAVNLATPSIGGTMNIITDPTAHEAGVLFRQEFGNDGFLKSTVSGHSGLIDDKWAVSATVVRKTGDGLIDATWTDAWAYYFGAAYNLNEDNRLEFYALGAPQRHGQNAYMQNIGAYSHDFAKEVDDYDPKALEVFGEAKSGRKYNQTWNKVSSSYTGQQWWNSSASDRYDPSFINERENFFHKPLANLNWFSQLTDDLTLYTIGYWSGGTGGGTGTFGSLVWDRTGPSQIIDFDGTIDRNRTNATGSRGILRNSRNDQNSYGLISKAYWKVNEELHTSFGIDWRTAQIEHFREVRDLLGGAYYRTNDSDFWSGPKDLKLGDKFNYNFTNTVDWFGLYGQGEYTMGQFTFAGTAGWSTIKYSFTDHFHAAKVDTSGNPIIGSGEYILNTDRINGYQVKGGASFRINEGLDVFGNLGYVSKVPVFDAVINDGDRTMADDPKNETFTHVELGINQRTLGGQLVWKGSLYYTEWKDRTQSIGLTNADGSEGLVFLQGMDQLHMGAELELTYQPMDLVRLDLSGSYGNWKHTDDARGRYRDYVSSTDVEFFYSVKDLYVGDAPQVGMTAGISFFPLPGLTATYIHKFYTNHYAQWDPFSRVVADGDTPDRVQPWKVPSYNFADIHLSYDVPYQWSGVGVSIFAHILNVFDTFYISDAIDNSSYNSYRVDGAIVNPHKADAAEVFLGLPMSFNLGIQISY